SETTGDLIRDRLKDDVGALFDDFIHFTDLPDRKDVEPMSKRQAKPLLYGDQAGDCNGCKRHFEIHDFHVDHIIPSSKGGGDFYANYQLLCGNCNSIKGNRPMEYLVKAIEARKAKRAVFGETPSS
ncbi:MAG: HNH endonuclease, partial [Gammaproteobacteria bacterium]|nr:HNH endonuclease [Gammaproteobacteria bacterium]